MIRLDATTRKLQAVLAGAITTSQLPCMVSYSDKTSTDYVGATQLANTNNTTQVDICAAPAASTVRDIDYVSVKNIDTASATVSIIYDDNATDYTVVKAALAVGDQLVYTHGNGWQVIASDGSIKTIGNTGATGDTGAQGPVGLPIFLVGEDGEEGMVGPPGIGGVAGTNGSNGATGAQGPLGPAVFLVADDGEDGPMGPPGSAGAASGAITSSGLTMSTARLLGRTTAATGAVEEITVGSGLSLAAGALTATSAGITLGTPVASTSGTSIDFTSIPSGTKRITINCVGVSTSGTSIPLIQLGDSGGVENTGYAGSIITTALSDGFKFYTSWAATTLANGSCILTLENASTNTWACLMNMGITGATGYCGGTKSLSGVLDRVRITTVGGSETFDAGEINITYES